AALPTVYLPFDQALAWAPALPVHLEIRSSGDRAVGENVIRRAVREADAAAVVNDVQSMSEVVNATISQERLLATLTGLFGILALTLASIGVYGVRSFAVSSRTREIGIRIALGATRAWVLGAVLRQGITLVLIGIALGAAAAMPLTRYVGGFLYELTPGDPTTYAAVAILFGLVAALASYVPARRATKVDPLAALRYE
ncbi:MAG: FtsX-like permease family protein, partial [Vicinamibacterales bacterium]